jgi:hypothetical protein
MAADAAHRSQSNDQIQRNPRARLSSRKNATDRVTLVNLTRLSEQPPAQADTHQDERREDGISRQHRDQQNDARGAAKLEGAAAESGFWAASGTIISDSAHILWGMSDE